MFSFIYKLLNNSKKRCKSEKTCVFISKSWQEHYANDMRECYNNHSKGGINMQILSDAKAIAKYILAKRTNEGNPISNLQLQKILYYCQGYFIKFFNQLLFEEPICKWTYGPVVPETYYIYNINGNRKIYEYDEKFDENLSLTRKEKSYIAQVIEKCTELPVSKLVSKTHEEMPWQNAKDGNEISIASIESFFENNDPLNLGDCNGRYGSTSSNS